MITTPTQDGLKSQLKVELDLRFNLSTPYFLPDGSKNMTYEDDFLKESFSVNFFNILKGIAIAAIVLAVIVFIVVTFCLDYDPYNAFERRRLLMA